MTATVSANGIPAVPPWPVRWASDAGPPQPTAPADATAHRVYLLWPHCARTMVHFARMLSVLADANVARASSPMTRSECKWGCVWSRRALEIMMPANMDVRCMPRGDYQADIPNPSGHGTKRWTFSPACPDPRAGSEALTCILYSCMIRRKLRSRAGTPEMRFGPGVS